MLTNEEKQELLHVARHTIEAFVQTHKRAEVKTQSAQLSEHRGAFVTLHKNESLRGCIGTFTADEPLIDVIQEMAIAAATRDPRFRPVTSDEVSQLHIEISVLSPLSPAKAEDVVVGKHGIFITHGFNRGVLLPQVATENGWDRETFLAQTCVKAGLPKSAWKEEQTKIEVFSAEIFSEEKHRD